MWLKSKLFVYVINYMRIYSDHMAADILIVSTRKGGGPMKFLMSGLHL